MIKKLLVIVLLLISSQSKLFAQSGNTSEADWEKIEQFISLKLNLQDVNNQLIAQVKLAKSSGNDIVLARSLYNIMHIRDLRTEDTLYFRNSAFIDTILRSPKSSAQLKAIFQIIQAERLNAFDHLNYKFNIAAYRNKNLVPDYGALTKIQRDSMATALYESALKSDAFSGSARALLWLSSNPDVFLFEPGFRDLVLTEMINRRNNQSAYNYPNPEKMQAWLSSSSSQFVAILDSLAATGSKEDEIYKSYRRWLAISQNTPEIASFIESLARKHLWLTSTGDSVTRQAYIRYLNSCINLPYPAVKAHAIYQLCLNWNEEGHKYANFEFSYENILGGTFKPEYQYLPQKALQLYQDNMSLINQYPIFSKVLSAMADQIKTGGIRVEMDDKFIPGQAIPIKAFYKNRGMLYYRIIKINAADKGGGSSYVAASAKLMAVKPIVDDKFNLPLPTDYNKHAVYLKLAPLRKGHYRLLFSDDALKPNNVQISNIAFEVTGIAAINTDSRVFVLDRKTGFPLSGAKVQTFTYKNKVFKKAVSVNPDGSYLHTDDALADSIVITYKGDTTTYKFSVDDYENNDRDAYDKDTDDDLDSYYNDKLTMHIFTDRSIYRPGQTVHYKIIFLTKTGTPAAR